LRDQSGDQGGIPHRTDASGVPGGIRSELEDLRVCGLRDRLNTPQTFGARDWEGRRVGLTLVNRPPDIAGTCIAA